MVLALLLLRKNSFKRRNVFLSISALVFILLLMSFASDSYAISNDYPTLKFSKYVQLQQYLVDEIAKAKNRVWLASKIISDGEITSSLYIARFRRLQTAVLLSEAASAHFSSQLPSMLAKQIPAAAIKDSFFRKWPTFILIDERLYVLSIPLDQHREDTIMTLRSPGPELPTQKFMKKFSSVFLKNFENKPVKKLISKKVKTKPKIIKKKKEKAWNGFKTYNYSKSKSKGNSGLVKKLPSATKTGRWSTYSGKK